MERRYLQQQLWCWLSDWLFPIRTVLVQMVSAAGTGYFFNTKRNRLRDKLVLRKHDPFGKILLTCWCHTHTCTVRRASYSRSGIPGSPEVLEVVWGCPPREKKGNHLMTKPLVADFLFLFLFFITNYLWICVGLGSRGPRCEGVENHHTMHFIYTGGKGSNTCLW